MSERSRGSGAGRGECDTACPSGSDGLCPSSNSPVPLFLLQHQPLGGGANVGGETAGGGLAPSQPWPPSGFVSSCVTVQTDHGKWRDQEGRRGSDEAVPGLSVFPSRDPGMSGNLWVSYEGCPVPFRTSRRNVGLLLRRCRGQGPHLAMTGYNLEE